MEERREGEGDRGIQREGKQERMQADEMSLTRPEHLHVLLR